MSRSIFITVKTALVLGALVAPIAGLIWGVPAVNGWEKANAYPFGQMCDSIFTGYVNTCPAR